MNELGLNRKNIRMPTRRRKGKFEKGTETRRMARESIGSPPPARVIVDKRRKPPKHKKVFGDDELP
jgi:hypothetical protein